MSTPGTQVENRVDTAKLPPQDLVAEAMLLLPTRDSFVTAFRLSQTVGLFRFLLHEKGRRDRALTSPLIRNFPKDIQSAEKMQFIEMCINIFSLHFHSSLVEWVVSHRLANPDLCQ